MRELYWDSSGAIFAAAIWVGIASLALTFFMIGGIVVMRRLFHRRELRHQRFLDVWRPVMIESVFQEPQSIPSLEEGDRERFIHLFNQYHSMFKGGEGKMLNRLASRLDLAPVLYRLLQTGNPSQKLTAIHALGNLRDWRVFNQLWAEAKAEDVSLSMAAARAMVKIDPYRAVALLLRKLAQRKDWPLTVLDRLLLDAGRNAASPALRQALREADEEEVPPLIRLLGAADEATASSCVGYWLEQAKKPETISACLQMVKDPNYLPLVRSYTKSPIWYLRLQAVNTMGRIGLEKDVPVIVSMLTDKEWWVRYRAAVALTDLPFLTRADIERIREAQTDQYARDVIDHVLAEARR